MITLAIGVFGLTVLPVTWWAVALVVLGLLLYAVDTAVAGFGPITLAATVAFAVGSWAFYDAEALALALVADGGDDPHRLRVLRVRHDVDPARPGRTRGRGRRRPRRAAGDRAIGAEPGRPRLHRRGAVAGAVDRGPSRRAKVGTPVRVHAVDGPVVLVEPFDAGAWRPSGDRTRPETASPTPARRAPMRAHPRDRTARRPSAAPDGIRRTPARRARSLQAGVYLQRTEGV
jgi:membrane-bound serine protease (ClpP class)